MHYLYLLLLLFLLTVSGTVDPMRLYGLRSYSYYPVGVVCQLLVWCCTLHGLSGTLDSCVWFILYSCGVISIEYLLFFVCLCAWFNISVAGC